MKHRTGIGHIPAAGAVSWACTCGAAEIWTYGRSTPPPWAMRLMARRAGGRGGHAPVTACPAPSRLPFLVYRPFIRRERPAPMTDKDPRDKDLPLADPRKTWWTAADIAVHWGVKQTTIHVYRTIPGRLPEEDDRIGGKPVWRPETITSFRRPGQGARTDLKDGGS